MSWTCYPVWATLSILNVAGFLATLGDKGLAVSRAARRAAGGRVPERWLLAIALFGGGPGEALGMALARHKTAKARFLVLFAAASVLGMLAWVGWLIIVGCWTVGNS